MEDQEFTLSFYLINGKTYMKFKYSFELTR